MSTVYLVWVNDYVVGVYASQASAERCAAMKRAVYGGAWAGECPRWWQTEGQIARLEIEHREVGE